MGANNAINNTILGIAGFGTSHAGSTTQVSVTPTITSVGVTSGMLINPIFTPSSGVLYGQQVNPTFNPQNGVAQSTVCGLFIAPTITPTGTGMIQAAYGLRMNGPVIASVTVVNATALYVTNASGIGTITNNYTAILGANSQARIGIGTSKPQFTLAVEGSANSNAVFGYEAGRTANQQKIALAEGYNQGGFGSGIVGTNKQMSSNNVTCFDLSTIDNGGFFGGAFDGRYVYLVPYNNGSSGTVVRYDTTSSFLFAGSYTVFNTISVNSNSKGFQGGVFDGRYIYFIPFNNGSLFGQITRYDTTQSFFSVTSYTIFNTVSLNSNSVGFQGGVFDGRYIYLVPSTYGFVTRYDTALSFTSISSYTVFNTASVNSLSVDFCGGLFDGRYIYLIPNTSGASGQITRYDTSLSFTANISYTIFDTTTVISNSKGFQGGVFDGRYIYLVPNKGGTSGQITRFDTTQSFTTSSNYIVFDTTAVNQNSKGFLGGVFDGRYVYLIPNNNGINFGQVTRYDTTRSFAISSSYTVFDTSSVHSNSVGFAGGIFDGRYVYLIPNEKQVLTRIDGYSGPLATAMVANQAPDGFSLGSYAGVYNPDGFTLIGGSVGVGINLPGATLHVKGIIYVSSTITGPVIYQTLNSLTTNNQGVTLFEGLNQGGFGGGYVGVEKNINTNSATTFNLNSIAGNGFQGGIFDGRYIYLIPYSNGSSGQVLCYDTRLSLNSITSYTVFNTTTVNSNSKGFSGGAFDGRYVYFVPFNNGSYFGQITRYDTTLSFTVSGSYSFFDSTNINTYSVGFRGGVFDGRYIYLVPSIFGQITRYDTSLQFTDVASYAAYDTELINTSSQGFRGGVFDGRYIYFVPDLNGTSGKITRYDTTLSFTSINSYTIFDSVTVHTKSMGFYGGIFDGRYIYFVPNLNGTSGLITRYDTTASFHLNNSYTTFDISTINTNCLGFTGAVFDQRYIYFIPNNNGSNFGRIARYDTSESFRLSSSYFVFNTASLNTNSVGFVGGVFDGRYAYLLPSANALITRIDAYPGVQATATAITQAPNGFAVGSYAGTADSNYNLIASDYVGLGASDPKFNLEVSGTVNATTVQAFTIFPTVGLTANNQKVFLTEGATQGSANSQVGVIKSMSANTTAIFDTAGFDGASRGFAGAVFDGRYVYYVPNYNGNYFGQVTRYDTYKWVTDFSAYAYFDLTILNPSCIGFVGGVFDGQFVYFIPNNNNTSGVWVQYKAALSFSAPASYNLFDITTIHPNSKGFFGAVFDGRFIYLSPNFSTIITRYDTTAPFKNTSSYTVFDLSNLFSNNSGFCGAIFDGRYVYFVPSNNGVDYSGIATRYDTSQSFTSTESYTIFNLESIHPQSKGFIGGVFDGRYVYFIPNSYAASSYSGLLTRYDTQALFTTASSYSYFDLETVNSESKGFRGGVFDGRYLYLVPNNNGSPSGVVARYDTTQSFAVNSSYTCFDLSVVNSSCKGFFGGIYDGQYVYFVPNSWGMATRISAYAGPLATVVAVSQSLSGFAVGDYSGINSVYSKGFTVPYNGLVVSGNVGIGTSSPQAALDVNGTINATQFLSTYPDTGLLGSTANNQSITLSQGYNQGSFGGGSVGTNKQMSTNSTAAIDLSALLGGGFYGATFDGRYIYLVPSLDPSDLSPSSGTVTRYDTMLPFSSISSYSVFDLTSIHSLSRGFAGGVYDGRYVYFVPLYNNIVSEFGQITRYDTTLSFYSASSYTVFNTATINTYSVGFYGGVYDGRYIYFVPHVYGRITRYDTTLSFTSSSSYTVFDTTSVNTNSLGFQSGVYDGRYIYLIPYTKSSGVYFGQITRYDTSLLFNAVASYTVFDTASINTYSVGFGGAVFDGQYVYLIPYTNGSYSGLITRYDTLQSFNSFNSYTCFDTASIDVNSVGFGSGVYDGRYIYLIPFVNGKVTRYDTTRSFYLQSSYTVFDTTTVSSNSKEFLGGLFDGNHVYLVPCNYNIFTRIDSYPGPRATAIAASQAPNGFVVGAFAGTTAPPSDGLLIKGSVGIGVTTPLYSLHVNSDLVFQSASNIWAVPSDVRIKKDIEDIPQALMTICKLCPRKFNYISEYSLDIGADFSNTYYGFIADEVEEVIENCVERSNIHCYGGKMKNWLGDSNNKPEPIAGLTNLKTFDCHNILIYSIQAVKELVAIVQKLQQQIDDLKKL